MSRDIDANPSEIAAFDKERARRKAIRAILDKHSPPLHRGRLHARPSICVRHAPDAVALVGPIRGRFDVVAEGITTLGLTARQSRRLHRALVAAGFPSTIRRNAARGEPLHIGHYRIGAR